MIVQGLIVNKVITQNFRYVETPALEGCSISSAARKSAGNDEEVQENAYFIENELCAYKDGEGEPETSCALQSESGIRVTVACWGWWFFGGSQCSALVDGVPVVASSCADALRTVVGEYGCCLQNIFGTEESIEEATVSLSYIVCNNIILTSYWSEIEYIFFRYIVGMIPPGTNIPSDFEVNVTDPALYAACGVSLPQMCPSQITSGGPTVTDPTTSTTATSATTGTPSSITLLTALLLALIAKLASY